MLPSPASLIMKQRDNFLLSVYCSRYAINHTAVHTEICLLRACRYLPTQ